MNESSSDQKISLAILIIGIVVIFFLHSVISSRDRQIEELNEKYDELYAEYDSLAVKYRSLEDDLGLVWCYFNEDRTYDEAYEAINRLNDSYYDYKIRWDL